MKRVPKNKIRILEKTTRRRMYNAIIDGMKEPPQSAKDEMERKPYSGLRKDA